MKKRDKKDYFKKGAASFYIVAFSTLILIIVAASFAAIIISEITRTSNDDLAQSAYDSALAGVEDAKLAFYNYQTCKEDEDNKLDEVSLEDSLPESFDNCKKIIWYVENKFDGYEKCDMVANILGRREDENGGEVLIQESKDDTNNMQQAYTCVTINAELVDYRATLSTSDPTKVIQAKFAEDQAEDIYENIDRVKISWYSVENNEAVGSNLDSEKGLTRENGGIFDYNSSVPPTIALGMVQTAEQFDMDSFKSTVNGQTNRGMIYLTPTAVKSQARNGEENKYEQTGDGNTISKDGFLKSNDKTRNNLPYAVYCPGDTDEEFLCSAVIALPDPVGGAPRNKDTFMFIVSLPYGPSTDFSLEFGCSNSTECGSEATEGEGGDGMAKAKQNGTQVSIDSTGRANDLYRRVEVRLSPSNASNPYAIYGIQLLGNGDGDGNLVKNFAPTVEWNFD